MKINIIRILISFAICAIFAPINSSADMVNSQGKDFWLAFPPNLHGLNEQYDSVFIFISAQQPTKGQIEFLSTYNTGEKVPFTISKAGEVFVYKRYYKDYEIDRTDPNLVETPVSQTFHVTSDADVTVVAHSQAVTTSDAALILPTKTLNMEYIVLSYNTNLEYNGSVWTPSQCVIVAPYAGTEVYIEQSCLLENAGLTPITITLDAGEVFYFNAANKNISEDLSGTRIKSSKPIAVFSSHQRTAIQYDYYGSRDFLFEQLIPVRAWGLNSLLFPLPEFSYSNDTYDIYRVIARFNNTKVNVNGVFTRLLNSGEFFEAELDGPKSIEADKQIMTAAYKRSCQSASNTIKEIGDPYMIIMPPKEQYLNKYTVINTQTYENYYKVYSQQFISIIAKNDDIKNVTIDGATKIPSFFQIPNSDYSYANIHVTDGVHQVVSVGNIGVVVSGYGQANSYGFLGGMGFEMYDYTPPTFTSKLNCYKTTGRFSDTSDYDSGIYKLTAENNVNNNVKVDISTFKIGDKHVAFSSELKDIYQDGSVDLVALDSMNYNSTLKIRIPGFTVSNTNSYNPNPVVLIKTLTSLSPHIEQIKLYNYGSFDFKVSTLRFKNPNSPYKLNVSLPVTIKAKDSVSLNVTFQSSILSLNTDTLEIGNACLTESPYIFKFGYLKDDTPPQFDIYLGSCDKSGIIMITDSTKNDYGLDNYQINQTSNCEVNDLQKVGSFGKLSYKVLNPDQDAIIGIIAKDLAGNSIQFYDTIPGFTVSASYIASNELLFADETIGSNAISYFYLVNSGSNTIKIRDLLLKHNTLFSIPRAQFPLTVPAHDSVKVFVSYLPISSRNKSLDRDTIYFPDNCSEKIIPIAGNGKYLRLDGDSKCDVLYVLSGDTVRTNTFVGNITPNPIVNNMGILPVTLSSTQNLKVDVYNAYGDVHIELLNKEITAGEFYLNFNLEEFRNGEYFIVITGKDFMERRKMVVNK